MVELPASKYIEKRDGGYYIAGTRIGLAVLVEEFRGGELPEAILQSYPSIGSLCKLYGAITFVLENPRASSATFATRAGYGKSSAKIIRFPPAFVTLSFKQAKSQA
jgi:uncharacterized protein (DUF433 family)